MDARRIIIKGASEHNLKGIDLEIPKDRLVVITGVSGSGKSSLAFDTIYAEGQRRYVESLSAYARQFLDQLEKPDVEHIEGLSPAISIEQRTAGHNPRSTVATVTEIHDYLRVLFARAGLPHCHKCGKPITSQTVQQMADRLMALPEGARFSILAPIVRGRKGEHKALLADMLKRGFIRARVNGKVVELGEPIALDAKKKHTIEVVVDRLVARPDIRQRLTDSLEVALGLSEGLAAVLMAEPADAEPILFSERLSCLACGTSLPEMSPRAFSFNSPFGACQGCGGLGTRLEIDPSRIIKDPKLPVKQALLGIVGFGETHLSMYLAPLMKAFKFTADTPYNKLSKSVRDILMFGAGDKEFQFVWVGKRSRFTFRRTFEGVIPGLTRRHRTSKSEALRAQVERFMSLHPCGDCGGARLRKESMAVTIAGLSIAAYSAMPVSIALETFRDLDLDATAAAIARPILKEIGERLGFLNDVGLGYLTLDRAAATLSGGEAQRIRLATQIGSRLTGVLYVLDEPSIGLHQRDNRKLLDLLAQMRDLGNTVIVVEHDEETIREADHLIDLGPGAGEHGGHLVAQGSVQDLMAVEGSLTGAYLSGRRKIEIPAQRRAPRGGKALTVRGATQHNLKGIDVSFPLGVLIAVTGVSGSGKSTLVNGILHRALARALHDASEEPGAHRAIEGLGLIDKVIAIDQSPIGRTPRSNPATYTDVFGPIRDLFSQVPESRARGYSAGRYSFNVKGGRCEACQGDGIKQIEMHFLPDVHVTCEECKGLRYNRETLEIRYKGRNISEVLDLSVDASLAMFGAVPVLRRRLETLASVGLGYIRLGQSATTLSGGEAQRIKLSRELSRPGTGSTLYLLDEPTTGLHFEDIVKLLGVLNRLVDAGNTVIVIEHNLDVIKTADHLIDLGPEGGEAGGRIVAQGSPEQVSRVKDSWTGRYLKKMLATGAPRVLEPVPS